MVAAPGFCVDVDAVVGLGPAVRLPEIQRDHPESLIRKPGSMSLLDFISSFVVFAVREKKRNYFDQSMVQF